MGLLSTLSTLRGRTIYRPLGRLLILAGFALAFIPGWYAESAPYVQATNQSCTAHPPRCVVSWDKDGQHYTDQIGPSHESSESRNLSTGGTNLLRVRGGHVVGLSFGLILLAFAMVFGGFALVGLGRLSTWLGAPRSRRDPLPDDYRPL